MRKKLILYSYLTITPVLLVICLALIAHNYRQVRDERLENDRVSVHALAESWNMQQTDIKDFSTYICVNQEIHELLTCDNPEKKNENSRLWMDEALLVLDRNGGVLSSVGNVDEQLAEYLQSEDFVKADYRKRADHFGYGSYEVICMQLEKNASIICKIVPRYNVQTQIREAAYMPLLLLLGMLLALLPLLVIISNVVTKPLLRLREAIVEVSTGDFDHQVEITTQDEIGEVAQCFNRMVNSIRELIEKNDVITLQDATQEMANTYADRPIITMSMGSLGVITRMAGEVFGSSMTFGAVGQVSAPGQIPVEKLQAAMAILHEAL